MSEVTGFRFDNVSNLPPFEDALVASVPECLSTVDDLLQSVAKALKFPAYFGKNWNALYDCLRDFHWTDKKNILLIHKDLPNISKSDLHIYLEVLKDAASDWKLGETHTFSVVFDRAIEKFVRDALE